MNTTPQYYLRHLCLVVCIFLSITASASAQVPKWKLSVNEQIKDYQFLQEGKYLWFTNYEYTWLFDASTGTKLYELRVKNWEKKGVHQLVGEKFLIGTSKTLQCYDALTGKLIWEQTYADVDQDEFTSLSFRNNNVVLAYRKSHVGIDITTGKELYRMTIQYNGSLVEKGAWNWLSLEKQNKLMVLLDGDKLGLFSYADGKQVFEGNEYEVSSKVIEKKYEWFYKSPNEQYALFLLNNAVAVMDVANNKELYRQEISYDTDYKPLMTTDHGCVVLGKKQVIFFNDSTGALAVVPASVSDFRTYKMFHVGGKEIFIAGLADAMFAIDLAAGKILWQSKKDDPNFAGYPHRYVGLDGTTVHIAYSEASGRGGTKLFLLAVDALTGSVVYKSNCIFNSKLYTPDWARSIAKFMISKVAGRENSFGYDNIGFDYTITPLNDKLVFSTVTSAKMINPVTMEEGGEGIVIIDSKTGKVEYSSYIQLTDYVWQVRQPDELQEVKPAIFNNYISLIGDENIAVYDLEARRQMFLSKKTLKGIPREGMIIDGTLYVKFGDRKYSVGITPPSGLFGSIKMDLNEKWDKDPYGFAAYDLTTGKQLWQIETENDPAFLTPNFSLKNNYDANTKRLYFADEKNIYALQLRPDGGKYDYVVSLEKSGIGEMPFKKTYAIQEWPIGTMKQEGLLDNYLTSRFEGQGYHRFLSAAEQADAWVEWKGWGTTVWGAAAKKCLRVVYADDKIFAIGSKAIALLQAGDGHVLWKHEWAYNPTDVMYSPMIHNSKLVYCLDRTLSCTNFAKGETEWETKEAKHPLFFNSPNEKFLYAIDEEEIRGYEIEKQ